MASILIVEDTKEFADMLCNFFRREEGYSVDKVYNKTDAWRIIERKEFDLVLLDLALEQVDRRDHDTKFEGLELLEFIRNKYPSTMVIIMTEYHQYRLDTLKKGAYDFIEKSRSQEIENELLIKIKNALLLKQFREREIEKVRREGVGLDDKGYLTINTQNMLERFNSERFLGMQVNEFDNLLEGEKFNRLTEKVSEEYVKRILDKADPSVRAIRDMLHDLIRDNRQLDVLLYLTQKRYRDHYKHQFLVGALGWFLLDILLPEGITLREQIEQQTGLSKDDINQAWWIASLLHDHGYPLSQILKSVREINQLEDAMGGGVGIVKKMKDLYTSYRNIFSQGLLTILEERDLNNIQTKFQQWLISFIPKNKTDLLSKIESQHLFDHGIVGAANMVSFLEERLSDSGTTINFISKYRWIKESLIAIAFHNSLDLCPEITFNEHPIAFLLKLCDELQEWDRKTFYKENVEGKLLIESDHIKLGCLGYDHKRKSYILSNGENGLSVLFEYWDPKKLENTGWNLGLFEDSKRKNLSTLKVSGTFLSNINFVVSKLNRVS